MKVDTSWENNKRSFYGFLAFLAVHVILNLLQIDLGIFQMILAVIAWYLVYKILEKKNHDTD